MEISRYQYIIGYGIGQYYDYIKHNIPSQLHLDFLCDAKWEQFGGKYDEIKVISPEELKTLKNVFVVVFSGNARTWQSISGILNTMGFPYEHIDKIIGRSQTITGKVLKALKDDTYTDVRGNRIIFSRDIEDSVSISFIGGSNQITISKGVSVGKLDIYCGNNALCTIGEGTEIEAAKFIIAEGSIEVGQDCLFSTAVILRNHDKHHIFDKATGKRINYAGNITIGNHVWIGYGATLLGSASIGDNSIIGTMAVTSASFPKEVVIAGNPARIIHENVCWSKDNTDFYNRNLLEECLAQEALKYM